MFGLGQTPNFVDQVGVGIPNVMKNPKVRFQLLKSFSASSGQMIRYKICEKILLQ